MWSGNCQCNCYNGWYNIFSHCVCLYVTCVWVCIFLGTKKHSRRRGQTSHSVKRRIWKTRRTPTNFFILLYLVYSLFCECACVSMKVFAEYLWCQSVVGFHCCEAHGSAPLCWGRLSIEDFWKTEEKLGFQSTSWHCFSPHCLLM